MNNNPSQGGLLDANRNRANFSGHGNARGAAGVRVASGDINNCDLLSEPGQSIAITPGQRGFEDIIIGGQWDNVVVQKGGFFSKLLKKTTKQGVDLDLGCLYELADGTRGAIQAFGNKFGALNKSPWIFLSGDERTGDAQGYDEEITVSGKNWDKIKRLIVYMYIYDGATRWSIIHPSILLDIPGENDLAVTLAVHNDALPICAVGGLENVRGGIKLTNYTEYFAGHMAMDRAFGFGLDWGDGSK